MANIFLISDTHFGHAGMCHFLLEDGSKARPWTDPDAMDQHMVEMWNKTVRPFDKVYHLGDVAIKRKSLDILQKLNGQKILIKGNHDIFKLTDYAKYFKDIRATHKLDKYILSHYPIHEESLNPWVQCNFHGHTHTRHVLTENKKPNLKYLNLCVECIEYTPISFEDAKLKHLKLLGENNG